MLAKSYSALPGCQKAGHQTGGSHAGNLENRRDRWQRNVQVAHFLLE